MRLSQEQGRLMDVSYPLTPTFAAYPPFPPLFCLYLFCHRVLHISTSLDFPFSHLTHFFERKSFSTFAYNLFAFNYKVCHQLYSHYPLCLQVQSLAQ